MTTPQNRKSLRRRISAVLAGVVIVALAGSGALSASAASYTRISGNGSSWAGNAVNQWLADVKAQGVTVDFTPDGSSSGRKNFAIGLSDFAVSEIPYKGDTGDKQDTNFPNFDYAMLPVVGGGTSFMYNLKVNGKRLTSLRLTQSTLADIFSGQITTWNDKKIKASNPGVNLPAQRITVVVRSDGSGATAQFTLWMLRQYPKAYAALCRKTGCDPKSATSYFPYQGLKNFTAQSGSNGVTTYTSNTAYTINYDEYSYALGVNFPVAQIENAAGFYTVPTDTAVAVALTRAKINDKKGTDNYLSQDLSKVYPYKDPRTYPISAYSYMIVPSETRGNFSKAKGATLGYFSTYALCEGQRKMGQLGYSPLPMNLVLAALDQVETVPGVDKATKATISKTRKGVSSGNSNPCNNPTFKPGDDPAHNVLVDTAPFPAECDAACQAPWRTKSAGTGGGGSGGGGGKSDNDDKDDNEPADVPDDSATDDDPADVPDGGGVVPGADAPVGEEVCDPETGVCVGGSTDAGVDADLVASPVVVAATETWGMPQLALGLSILFALGVIVAPPVISQVIGSRSKSRRAPGGGQ